MSEVAAGARVGPGRPAAAWREVAVPREHGGWSLTAEPALLGLLAAWSGSGAALGVAAMVAFVARTPLKVVLVDRFRHRWLARTGLALGIAVGELVLLAGLAAVAVAGSDRRFWVPLALAGGSPGRVAAGLWCVIGARAAAAIPYVRVQVARAKGRPHRFWPSDLAQVGAVAAVAGAWAADAVPLAAVLVLAVSGVVALVGLRLPIRPAPLIGAEQAVVGLTVVLAAGLATRLMLI